VVQVIGWTREFTPDVDVVGQGAPSGRSAIVARAAVGAGDGIANGAARRELVRGPNQIDLPDEEADIPVVGSLWQFTLPAGSDPTGLRLDVPYYVARADVWDGTAWVPIDDDLESRARNQFGGGDPAQIRHADVPPGIGADGVVWVRGWMQRDFTVLDGVGLELVSEDPA
jgi:hypothetical protein